MDWEVPKSPLQQSAFQTLGGSAFHKDGYQAPHGPALKAEYSSQTASSTSVRERPGNLPASVLMTDISACCSSPRSMPTSSSKSSLTACLVFRVASKKSNARVPQSARV